MALTKITRHIIKPNESYDTHNINSTGIITAISANFSGNVSIAGTLTYDDVTNVDSIGIISARSGINVLQGGINVTGVSTFADKVNADGGLEVSGGVLTANNNINTSAVRRKSHTNTRLEFPANNEISLQNSSGSILRVKDDRVGINSVTPRSELDVRGNAIVSGVSTFANTISIAETIEHTGDTNTSISFPSNDYIRLTTSGSSRLNATPNGYILLGTNDEPSGGDAHARNARILIQGRIGNTADSGRLNLQRGSAASNDSSIGSITFTDNSNNAYARIETQADAAPGTDDYPGRIVFSTTKDGESTPTEKLRITSDGKFGFGTNDPQGTVHISSGTSGDATLILEADTDNNNEADNPYIVFKQDGGVSASAIGHGVDSGVDGNGLTIANSISSGFISFATGSTNGYTNATERLRITSAGDVGIGTNNPSGAADTNNTAILNVGVVTANSYYGGNLNVSGIDVTGHIEADTLRVSGISTFQSHVRLNDNNELRFGDSNDLKIYHESTFNNSVIKESGSGNLLFGGKNIDFRDAGLGDTYAIFRDTGANKSVELNYNGSKKFETTGYGVTVFGTTQTQQLNVTGIATFNDHIIATSKFTIGDAGSITGGAPIDKGVIGVYGTGRDMLTIQTNDNSLDRGIAFRNNGDKYAGIVAMTDRGNNKSDMIFGVSPSSASNYNNPDNVPELLRLTNEGNVGIGTTAPTALLHVQNDSVSNTKIIIESTGTNSYPALRMINDARSYDLGIDGATDALRVYDVTGSTERFRITSAGKVGINSTAPETGLDIRSDDGIFVRTTTNAPTNGARIQFTDQANMDQRGFIRYKHSDNSVSPGSNDGFLISGTEALTVVKVEGRAVIDEKVGIGTDNPTATLHVKGIQNAGGILVEDSSTSTQAPAIKVIGKRSDANIHHSFSGKLLLAKNYTGAKIQGNDSILGTVAFGGNHTTGNMSNILYAASIHGVADGSFDSATDMPTALAFRTGSTGRSGDTNNVHIGNERLRITSSGNVIIGGTTPATVGQTQLTLRSNSQVGLALLCGAIQNSSIYMGGLNDGYSPGDSGYSDGKIMYDNNNNHMQFDTAGTERLRITSAGNVSINNDSGKFTAGTSDDLQIYHDGSNSYIDDNGTGDLQFRTINGSAINLIGGSEYLARFVKDGAVELYHNNSNKLQTTSIGIGVTGVINSTDAVIAGAHSGGVALTINDGHGNANVTFNHRSGSPDIAGNSFRIETNVDQSTANSNATNNPTMTFEGGVASSAGGSLSLSKLLRLRLTEGADFPGHVTTDAGNFIIGSDAYGITWDDSGDDAARIYADRANNNFNIDLNSANSSDISTFRIRVYNSMAQDYFDALTYNIDSEKLSISEIERNGTITIDANGGGADVRLEASDNVIINSGETEDGAIYFRGNSAADSYRFAKSGQTTIEGFLSFQSLTTDRTFTFPDAGGTIALTSDISSSTNATTLDNLDSTSFLRSDASDTYDGTTSGRVMRFACVAGRTANTTAGSQFPLEVFQSTQNADAAMTFHVGSDHARYFGVDGTTNDLFTGGWSVGATKHKIWHAGNDGVGSGLDADLLDGHHRDAGAATANTVAGRNESGDIHCRLIRQTFQNESDISGGIVYRVNNSNNNYLRVCSSPSAIRTFLGVSATGGDANYLNVAGDTATGTMTFNGTVNIRSVLDFADGDVLRMGSSDDWSIYFNSNNWTYINQKGNGIIFQDNNTNVMRLEDSGVFRPENNNGGAIGSTTRRWNVGYFRYLRGQSEDTPGSGNTTTGFAMSNGGVVHISRDGDIPLKLNRNNTGTILQFRRANVEHGRVILNTQSAPGVSYSTNSDYRLKENVVVLDNAINRVKQLLPKRFNFIGNTHTVDGFLAHEAQTVVPEAVDGTKDEMENIGTLTEWDGTVIKTDIPEPSADEMTWEEMNTDENGNQTTETRTRTWTQTGNQPAYQGIDQAKLVPLVTAALQEAIAKIEVLETQNANLLSRIEALE